MTTVNARPTLRQGSKGDHVERFQAALAAKGFSPGPADGDFGPMTGQAVERFQRARGLEVDGSSARRPGRRCWEPGRRPTAIG